MLSTSQDILNIVLAVSIFSIAFLISWALYYLVMIFRQLFRTVQKIKTKVDRADEVIQALKNKIDSSSSYLLLIGEGIKKLVEVMKNKNKNKDNN